MRPQNRFHYEGVYHVVSLSVTLMISIAQAHAYEQGNKRTAFTSGVAFLIDNGYNYFAEDDAYIAKAFTATVTGEAEESNFEALIASNTFEI